ncbi:hypothetical protein Poli38472_013010 [Pythium oligandrum]|uniref:Indole-3-glycerol phosphate synthase n=1 Tax=Pythium oligandrum TaxID=41045 RepID=A0A8K1CL78_PYTOL|nr:hypothetical protein Poli38472_013010 [Pythium oligandrum]|eukprot:TMW64388.1 hypothetical protein Poli38472_013010 [Pythium oligandrum]
MATGGRKSDARDAVQTTTATPHVKEEMNGSKDHVEGASNAGSAASGGGAVATKGVVKSKFCLNCQKDLTRTIRITCAECVHGKTAQPLIELCIECFGVGIELGGHKKTHKYTVSDCLAFPLVREHGAPVVDETTAVTNGAKDASSVVAVPSANEWTADEELLLLEAIEMFGMGNWKDIAEHVATKNEKKCETHYLGAYLSRTDLLPRFLDEPDSPDDVEMVDASVDLTSTSEQTTTTTTEASVLPERPSGSELAGYMPLRGDFDVEYENEAELILADMEFSEDDHPTERELKLKVIEIYNAKLDERARRKKFVVERGLLDYKKHQQSERRRPKDEREIIAQLRPFARFQSPKEHEEFVNGLITAMRLRKQILLLQEYRKNGVRTLAEAELYDVEKKKRETEQALQKQRESASYLYESARPYSGGRDRASRLASRGSEANGGDSVDDASRSRAAAFDIDGTPGSHLLTPKEKELCVKLKLLPKHYLVIKDALVRECYRLGYLTEQTAKDIVKIDVNKTGQIYEFFVNCGWVRKEASLTTVAVPTAKPAPSSTEAASTATDPASSASPSASTGSPLTPAKRKADELTPSASISTVEELMSILDEITAQRRVDVAHAKQQVAPDALRTQIQTTEAQFGPALDVIQRLNAPAPNGWSQLALAAEFKRASPSKGDIAVYLRLEDQAHMYASAGASMISVLTEPKWFKGSLEDMQTARATVETVQNRPAILRKDFIIDEYQLLEARAYGADCVLLIVAILTPEDLTKLIKATLALGMTPLVEVNSVEELHIAIDADARLIGVNNRDLRTFKLDLDTTVRIADAIRAKGIALGPQGVSLLALSGIHTRADVIKFEQCGAQGILVGESLMKSGDVKVMIRKLMEARRHSGEINELFPQPLAKICGITKVEYAEAALRSGANLIGLIFVEHSPRYLEIEQAKKIVDAVRAYGERTERILPKFLEIKGVESTLNVCEWYQRNASALRDACARTPLVVGVFANKSAAEINEIADKVGLDIVQLHGDEGFEICREINVPTVRVFHLPDHMNSDSVDAEGIFQHVKPGLANFLLLDTTVKGQQGGTGMTFDWKIAALFNQARLPCLMAGGLTAENVGKAIAIAQPLGVDVSSGVEVKGSPGVKDLDRVARFLKTVKDHLAVASLKIDEGDEGN